MEIKKVIFECLERITGITEEEFMDDPDFDLYENAVLDSLAVIAFLGEIEEETKKKLSINEFRVTDFKTVNAIIKAIEEKLS